MTDNEIIKTLECCKTIKGGCRECPLEGYGGAYCQFITATEAYRLIHRQQAEIEKLESADVEPVKYAKWIRNGWNDYSCSYCNSQYIGHGALAWNFCPYCGAKMECE